VGLQLRHPIIVVLEANLNLIEQASIDFEDDIEVTKQHFLKPLNLPLSQGLRQQSVVCVCECPCCQLPRLMWASSSRMRINSGTAMAGWVSLSWIATLAGSSAQSECLRSGLRPILLKVHISF
jgi:hypothetical protein